MFGFRAGLGGDLPPADAPFQFGDLRGQRGDACLDRRAALRLLPQAGDLAFEIGAAAQFPFVGADEALQSALLLPNVGQLPTESGDGLLLPGDVGLSFLQQVLLVLRGQRLQTERALCRGSGDDLRLLAHPDEGGFGLLDPLFQAALLGEEVLELLSGLTQGLFLRGHSLQAGLCLLQPLLQGFVGKLLPQRFDLGLQGAEPLFRFPALALGPALVVERFLLQAAYLSAQALCLGFDEGLLGLCFLQQAIVLPAQPRGLRFDARLRLRLGLHLAVDGLQLLAPAALFLLEGAVALQPRADVGFAVYGAAVVGDLHALGGHLLAGFAQAGFLLRPSALEVLQPSADGARLLFQPVEFGQGLLGGAAAEGCLLDTRLGALQLRLVVGTLRQFLAQVVDLLFEHVAPDRSLLVALFDALPVAFPGIQAQDVGEDPLAFRRSAGTELVGVALAQVGGVDEGVVFHPQGFDDGLLGLAHGTGVERGPFAFDLLLEVERRLCAFAVALAPAQDAEAAFAAVLVGHAEGVLDGGHHLAVGDEGVVGTGAGFAPHGPGDGVEEGRFARAVFADEDGEVKAAQVQDRVAVRKEALQVEFLGDHRSSPFPLKPRATMKVSQLSLRVACGVKSLTGWKAIFTARMRSAKSSPWKTLMTRWPPGWSSAFAVSRAA